MLVQNMSNIIYDDLPVAFNFDFPADIEMNDYLVLITD